VISLSESGISREERLKKGGIKKGKGGPSRLWSSIQINNLNFEYF
jgi:hypothetical protein